MQIEVPRIPLEELRLKHSEEAEEEYRTKIEEARKIQEKRFVKDPQKIYANSQMTSKQVDQAIVLDKVAEEFLKKILEKNFISARGYYRTLKVAQTIADLEKSERVKEEHLAEAFRYRLKTNE
ncbi:MAG: hypothetical protein AAB884_00965 [Patescibacteria group bacterium]